MDVLAIRIAIYIAIGISIVAYLVYVWRKAWEKNEKLPLWYWIWEAKREQEPPTELSKSKPALPAKDIMLELPPALEDFVERESFSGGFASPAEYIYQLIRKEHQQTEKELQDNIKAGLPRDSMVEFWGEKIQPALQDKIRAG